MKLNNKNTEDKNALISTNIKKIAELCEKENDISSALTSNTINNIKAFLVSYSRSQLNRVIKLTDALGKLEDELIEKSLSVEDIDSLLLMRIVKTIQKSLDSALSMIKQITSDESYINAIVNSNNTISNTINKVNVDEDVSFVLSQDSRETVRTIVGQILEKVKELDTNNEDNKEVDLND